MKKEPLSVERKALQNFLALDKYGTFAAIVEAKGLPQSYSL